ncbi:Putative branched-chain-amino-acid aminotransferase [Candidatus Lokiarchaeum ossiferum]|uniref:Branched-chain-amino-acid aminotransferase n=1 Tax=Candidatus Lokiarchaeum ossiferum TaxID=2951803 RepID=A0ABY6HNS4_9ARCH|nr:Putative branched-chain-amino-acid aminotransferase [Candidatus Lokiarchaeum sp. B-35]
MAIKITKSHTLKKKPVDESTLGFGKIFSDHMLIMHYKDGQWGPVEIKPYGNLELDPACCSLHYGQLIFEGMKCYSTKEGLQLFRPRENFKRMNRSAERMVMAQIDIDIVMEGLKELLRIEKDWVPTSKGTALYIRPTMIGSEAFLGVHPSNEYIFYIIVGPVGAYYAEGFAPIKIMVEDKYVRAVAGGVGNAKTAGNYAASMKSGLEAAKKGFSQVLWLDGKERKYVEEVGAMNMMFVLDGKVITAALDEGSILPGITRDSVIQLLKKKGIPVEERKLSIDEVIAGAKDGKLSEAFGTGTAAVISPVGSITYKDQTYEINNNKIGKITQELYDELTGIQTGDLEDTFGWVEKV